MKHSELPITLWNGKYLDGILIITTNYILEPIDVINNISREVNVVMTPASKDMQYIAITNVSDSNDSIAELLNTITYEYIDMVILFKNRELESGSTRLH